MKIPLTPVPVNIFKIITRRLCPIADIWIISLVEHQGGVFANILGLAKALDIPQLGLAAGLGSRDDDSEENDR